MIKNTDRSGYFGASDTHKFIMNDNTETKTWQSWWLEKIGLITKDFQGNIYTRAGNSYEHSILKAVDENITLDEQLIYEPCLLRVNYDGTTEDTIYEVKTHTADKEIRWDKGSAYWEQIQVQMWCWKRVKGTEPKAFLVEYPLTPVDYCRLISDEDAEAGNAPVDKDRIKLHPIEYDSRWAEHKYKPRLKRLARRLRKETGHERPEINIHEQPEQVPDNGNDNGD